MLAFDLRSLLRLAAVGLSVMVTMTAGVSAQGGESGSSPPEALREACRSTSQEAIDQPIDPQEIIARHDRALAVCDRLIDGGNLTGPALTAALVARADLLAPGTGDRYRRALADYARALTLTPNDATIFHKRGQARLLYFRDLRGALADLDAAIRLEPSRADFFVTRGSIRTSLNDRGNALADLDRAVMLAPGSAKARSVRGLLHLDRRDYARAIADFDVAISLSPEADDNYRFRAAAKRAAGDVAGGQSDEAEAEKRLLRSVMP